MREGRYEVFTAKSTASSAPSFTSEARLENDVSGNAAPVRADRVDEEGAVRTAALRKEGARGEGIDDVKRSVDGLSGAPGLFEMFEARLARDDRDVVLTRHEDPETMREDGPAKTG